MLKIKVVSDYDGFRKRRDAWEELLSRSGADNVFLTYEWVDACIRHFYKDQRLLILYVFEGDRPVGIAPLVIRKYGYFGLPVKAVSFIGTIISDRMDFILDGNKKEIMASILEYLMGINPEWDFIDFQEMAEHTGNAETIKAWLKDRKVLKIIGPPVKSFFIHFNGNKDSSCRKFSRNLRAGLNKIKNRGSGSDARFERYINKDMGQDGLFYTMNTIEDLSWKGEKRLGIFSKENTRDFHREIFDTFSKKRWLDISVLSLNEKPIAYAYSYIYGKRSYVYNIAFDKRYSDLSPGTALTWWILKDSLDRGLSEFDFIRGGDSWKNRFTQDFKTHNRVRIFKRNPYCRFLYFLQARVMPYMKSKKSLYKTWMKIKEKMEWE